MNTAQLKNNWNGEKRTQEQGFLYLLTIVLIAIVAIITSCKSPSEKVVDAENMVHVAKMDLRAVERDSMAAVQKVSNVEEWKIFRNESQVKIKNNEIRIDALKK